MINLVMFIFCLKIHENDSPGLTRHERKGLYKILNNNWTYRLSIKTGKSFSSIVVVGAVGVITLYLGTGFERQDPAFSFRCHIFI